MSAAIIVQRAACLMYILKAPSRKPAKCVHKALYNYDDRLNPRGLPHVIHFQLPLIFHLLGIILAEGKSGVISAASLGICLVFHLGLDIPFKAYGARHNWLLLIVSLMGPSVT